MASSSSSHRLVVDKINSAASLYSESILGHPIALLFKAAPVGLTRNVQTDHVLSSFAEHLERDADRRQIYRDAFPLQPDRRNKSLA